MLSGKHQKFCEAFLSGKNATEAYLSAYGGRRAAAWRCASRLLAKPKIVAELDRMRTEAQARAGSGFMTLIEKRMFLARLVRASCDDLSKGLQPDLLHSLKQTEDGVVFTIFDKLAAINLDNDLAGHGRRAKGKKGKDRELSAEEASASFEEFFRRAFAA